MVSEAAQRVKNGMNKFFELLDIKPSGNPWHDISTAWNLVSNADEDDDDGSIVAKSFVKQFFQNYDKNGDLFIDQEEFALLIKDISMATGKNISQGTQKIILLSRVNCQLHIVYITNAII